MSGHHDKLLRLDAELRGVIEATMEAVDEGLITPERALAVIRKKYAATQAERLTPHGVSSSADPSRGASPRPPVAQPATAGQTARTPGHVPGPDTSPCPPVPGPGARHDNAILTAAVTHPVTVTDPPRGPAMAATPPANLTDVCPPWCIEHYVGECGTHNHAGPADRSVIGESAQTGEILELGVWPELRRAVDGRIVVVGIVQIAPIASSTRHRPEDVELTACQLRDLAAHLAAVADQLHQAGARALIGPLSWDVPGDGDTLASR